MLKKKDAVMSDASSWKHHERAFKIHDRETLVDTIMRNFLNVRMTDHFSESPIFTDSSVS